MQEQFFGSRRFFLKFAATATGLAITGFSTSNSARSSQSDAHHKGKEFPLLTIHADNTITIYNTRAEMGQGVMTSLTQMLMEDLDADWQQIEKVEHAWADDQRFGHQNTIGAISSLIGWNFHRQAGAKINQLLRQGAAKIWRITTTDVTTECGYVLNKLSGQRLTFGQVATVVSSDLPKERVEVKPSEKFSIIGHSKPRLDVKEKVNGSARFGIDSQLPEMKVAVVLRCPVFGGKVKSFDATAARAVDGVVKIVVIPSGIAVIAAGYWQANKARQLLNVEWDEGEFAQQSSKKLLAALGAQLKGDGKIVKNEGDVTKLTAANTRALEFSFPLVAHMTMEPMNCTVSLIGRSCQIWAPTQNPNDARRSAAKTLGLAEQDVNVNMTYIGGGFGRRAQDDFVVEACEVAKHCVYPVKVIWSREDDLQHDFYRPLNCQRISASVENGLITAWQHKVATLSTSPYHFSLQDRNTDAGDWVAYGGADSTLYNIANFQTQVHLTKTPLTVGILRGISHGYTHFAIESMIDVLAIEQQQSPIDFRLAHISEPRAQKVLTQLKQKLSDISLTDNKFVGVAFGHEKAPQGPYQYYNAAAAIIKKVKGTLTVEKIILVLDHGQVINPDGLLAQAQGSVMFAVSMMFGRELILENGRIIQSNFHDQPVARISDAVEVELSTTGNADWPMGVGEKLQGTIQPAIANAICAATGERITSLPIDLTAFNIASNQENTTNA